MWAELLLSTHLVAAGLLVDSAVVAGHVLDALALSSSAEDVATDSAAPFALVVQDGRRALVALSEAGAPMRIAVPDAANFVDVCRPGRAVDLVFATPTGLWSREGAPLIRADGLFHVVDRHRVFRASLCGRTAQTQGERRFFTSEALWVQDGPKRWRLDVPPHGRSYRGDRGRSYRAARAYDAAQSVYAPRIFERDIDGDGRVDLILVHESTVRVFRRATGGELPRRGHTLDLTRALPDSAGHPLRILVDDVDGDGRAEIIVGESEAGLPEDSRIYTIAFDRRRRFQPARKLWQRTGLVSPLAVLRRSSGPLLVVSSIDTSLVALSAVVFSGSTDVGIALRDAGGAVRPGPTLTVDVDVRKMRMVGATPVLDVDFDGDGWSDLLDLGRSGSARLYWGTAEGYQTEESAEGVPAFSRVVALPAARAVVLIAEPKKTATGLATSVTVLRARRGR